MKITETGDYLRIALQTLEAKIAPEMTTPDGQAAAAILGRVLNELARRETVSAPALAANLATGRDILDKLTNFADTHLPAAVPSADTGRSDESQFSPLAGKHERLSQRLCSLAAALADARPGLDGDQQGALSALLLDMARWDEAFVSAQRTLPLSPAPQAPAHRGAPLTQDLLEAFLRTVHPDGSKVTVTQFKPIPGGFGKQTSRLRYTDAAGIEHDAIVRKSDPVPMTAMGAFSIANEFALLRAVHGAGILPLAEPLWLARDFPGVDADFYIMSALPGAVPSSFLGAASARIPENIILEMAEKMARLAEVESALWRLLEEQRKTQKRVNALKYNIIPRFWRTIKKNHLYLKPAETGTASTAKSITTSPTTTTDSTKESKPNQTPSMVKNQHLWRLHPDDVLLS